MERLRRIFTVTVQWTDIPLDCAWGTSADLPRLDHAQLPAGPGIQGPLGNYSLLGKSLVGGDQTLAQPRAKCKRRRIEAQKSRYQSVT
jgi:hypothetical protein